MKPCSDPSCRAPKSRSVGSLAGKAKQVRRSLADVVLRSMSRPLLAACRLPWARFRRASDQCVPSDMSYKDGSCGQIRRMLVRTMHYAHLGTQDDVKEDGPCLGIWLHIVLTAIRIVRPELARLSSVWLFASILMSDVVPSNRTS